MSGSGLIRAGACVLVGLCGAIPPPARACMIPVFRYALERWPPDFYGAIVLHRGPLTPEQASIVERLRASADEAPFANLAVETVDLAKARDAAAKAQDDAAKALWEAQGKPELPWIVLRYPRSAFIEHPAWSGPLRPETAGALLSSPLRKEIAKRILGGASAVWLLLESGDRAKDEAAAKRLESALRKAQKELALPEMPDFEGMPDAEGTPGAAVGDSGLPGAAGPDGIAPEGPPMRVDFPLLRLSRKDPAEAVLVRVLLSLGEGREKTAEPMAFVIFGRGRVLGPLAGDQIDEENVIGGCAFLLGPCSCQVKAQNPGIDLLMAADWEAPFAGGGLAYMELPSFIEPPGPAASGEPSDGTEVPSPQPASKVSAPALGLSEAVPAAKEVPASGKALAAGKAPAAAEEPTPSSEPADAAGRTPRTLARNIALALGLALAAVVGLTIALLVRRSSPEA